MLELRPSFDSALRAQLRLGQARPPIVWTAALLYLCGAIRSMLAVTLPLNHSEPVAVAGALGLSAGIVAGALWLWGSRLPQGGYHVLIAATTAMVCALIANEHTRGGEILTAFAFPWIGIYSAHFFAPRAAVAQIGLIGLGFGAALIAGGQPHMALAWVMVMGTVVTLAWILARLNNTLRRQADTDQLTGLLNRSGFFAAATRAHANATRSGEPLTLVVLDLDGFKQVNDSLGHAAGDRLLAAISAAWLRSLRAGDVLGRQGGDEFVLLLPGTARDGASQALARMHVPELPIEWSAGVSEWAPDEDIDSALARADRDLYKAKGPVADENAARSPSGDGSAATMPVARLA